MLETSTGNDSLIDLSGLPMTTQKCKSILHLFFCWRLRVASKLLFFWKFEFVCHRKATFNTSRSSGLPLPSIFNTSGSSSSVGPNQSWTMKRKGFLRFAWRNCVADPGPSTVGAHFRELQSWGPMTWLTWSTRMDPTGKSSFTKSEQFVRWFAWKWGKADQVSPRPLRRSLQN